MKTMLIDALVPQQVRVGIIDKDNLLEEIIVDNGNNNKIKGNIYLAKIIKVEGSLEAAFIDYGGKKQGFINFSDIHPSYFWVNKNNKNFQLNNPQFLDTLQHGNTKDLKHSSFNINQVIRAGQMILVQAIKEERGSKLACFSSYVSLNGRYSILMPKSNATQIAFSRKIKNIDRKNLKTILGDLIFPQGMSAIIRTAYGSDFNRSYQNLNHSEEEPERLEKIEDKESDLNNKEDLQNNLIGDLKYLMFLWNKITEQAVRQGNPGLVHHESNLVIQAVRDRFKQDIGKIVISGKEAFNMAVSFFKLVDTSKIAYLQENSVDLFKFYKLEDQINALYKNKINLESGGSVIINYTEALTSIDVNSGKTKGSDLETVIFKTNIEACKEIFKQINLRDISGLIVVDFIDMNLTENISTVEKTMRELFKQINHKVEIGGLSQFGLMQISRQRSKPPLHEEILQNCPCCLGVGKVIAAPELLNKLFKEIINNYRDVALDIYLESSLLSYLINYCRPILETLEYEYNLKFTFLINNNNNEEPFKIRQKIETELFYGKENMCRENFYRVRDEKLKDEKLKIEKIRDKEVRNRERELEISLTKSSDAEKSTEQSVQSVNLEKTNLKNNTTVNKIKLKFFVDPDIQIELFEKEGEGVEEGLEKKQSPLSEQNFLIKKNKNNKKTIPERAPPERAPEEPVISNLGHILVDDNLQKPIIKKKIIGAGLPLIFNESLIPLVNETQNEPQNLMNEILVSKPKKIIINQQPKKNKNTAVQDVNNTIKNSFNL